MPTVLLADAARDEREMYAEYLRLAGYASIECASGGEALARAVEADVIVVSTRVTGPLRGLDVVRRLRLDPVTTRAPLIVLGGWDGDREDACAAGCDRFLLTPYAPDALAREIRRLLNRRARAARRVRAGTRPGARARRGRKAP